MNKKRRKQTDPANKKMRKRTDLSHTKHWKPPSQMFAEIHDLQEYPACPTTGTAPRSGREPRGGLSCFEVEG